MVDGTTPNPSPNNAAQGDDADMQSMVDEALAEARGQINEIQKLASPEASARPASVPDFTADVLAGLDPATATGIELLKDVDLNVVVELGRTQMLVEEILRLSEGSVVELDKLAGDPVDVYVNNRLVARGEVLVLNDNFCIRISEIVADLEEEVQAAAEGGRPQAT